LSAAIEPGGDRVIRPPRLREGARVALVAPAGPVSPERVEAALERCARLGLEPVFGAAARGNHGGYLAGTDEERLADLNAGFVEPGIDAVWALSGGYGTMRLLPRLELTRLPARPRAFIGFSDNTAIHMALRRRGLVSFHAPHAGGRASQLSEACFRRVLFHARPAGVLALPTSRPPVTLSGGAAQGPLTGGNLALLAALCGTPAAPVARGAILVVEDIGEPLYRIDRAWTQLLLAGVLDGVAGIAFGRFTDCDDGVLDLLAGLTAPLGVPVLAELPIGHEADNWTLPLGAAARLDADAASVELLEAAVT
jgi:muramoyltetrapeptide carboxypeptidase